jgi:DNA uptake protein ComE-like DNA-binding protein
LQLQELVTILSANPAHMWKRLVTGYFSFTKKERTGIMVIGVIVSVMLILPETYDYFIPEKTYDYHEFETAIAALKTREADSIDEPKTYVKTEAGKTARVEQPPAVAELFYFDPNTATVNEWKRLGVRDKTITTIQNYLSKGGKFYKKEDLAKIWGFRADELSRLLPLVQITPNKVLAKEVLPDHQRKEYKETPYLPAVVDINTADTAALIALPGIGSKLSERIIRFRDKLGGFHSLEQVGETFGLPDSTFQKIKPYLKMDQASLKQININHASVEEMKSHPYLRYALANAIVQYRLQHGSYRSIDDIRKIQLVTDEIFLKLSPYLTTE